MAFEPSKPRKSRSTIVLEPYRNQNGPTNSAEEPKIQSLVTPPSYFASGITARIQKLDAGCRRPGQLLVSRITGQVPVTGQKRGFMGTNRPGSGRVRPLGNYPETGFEEIDPALSA